MEMHITSTKAQAHWGCDASKHEHSTPCMSVIPGSEGKKVQTHWHATTAVRKGEPVLCHWYLGSGGLTLKSRELYVQVTDGIKAKLQHNWDVNTHTGDQRQGWTGIPATELHPQPSRPLLMGTLTQQEFKCNCEQDTRTHYHIIIASKITWTTSLGPPQKSTSIT